MSAWSTTAWATRRRRHRRRPRSQGRRHRPQGRSGRLGAGAEIRAYQRGDHTFQPTEGVEQVRDAQGRLWQITEDALVGPDGQALERLGGHLAYWFGWVSYFPRTTLYGE